MAINYVRDIYRFKDGGTSTMDTRKDGDAKSRPLVIILPGIMSNQYDSYMHTFTKKLEENEFDWCLLNYRGISTPLVTPRPFRPGDSESFKEMIRHQLKLANDSG